MQHAAGSRFKLSVRSCLSPSSPSSHCLCFNNTCFSLGRIILLSTERIGPLYLILRSTASVSHILNELVVDAVRLYSSLRLSLCPCLATSCISLHLVPTPR